MWFQLMRNIIAQPWAIDPAYVESMTPFLTALLNKENPTFEVSEARSSGSSAAAIPPGSIALIKMSGPMMKDDQFCGPSGTATIAQSLKDAAANPNVDGIIFQVDSPGGTVDGTETLAKTFASIKKPKVAFVDGMAASAGMWAISGADKIILNGETAMVGSIGTMMSFADLRPVLEKAGVKFHSIKASRSVDKNADFEAATSASDYAGYIKNTLDPLNNVFTGSIEKNRAGKIDLAKEDVLTGKMYIGKAAIKAGLADSIGNFESAVQTVQQLITDKKTKKSGMTLKSKYPKTAVVAAFAENAEALENGGVELSATELQAIEEHITANSNAAALQSQIDALTTERDAANASLVTANESVTALTTERNNLAAQVETLGNKTEDITETPKEADNTTGKKKAKNSMDEYAAQFGH